MINDNPIREWEGKDKTFQAEKGDGFGRWVAGLFEDLGVPFLRQVGLSVPSPSARNSNTLRAFHYYPSRKKRKGISNAESRIQNIEVKLLTRTISIF